MANSKVQALQAREEQRRASREELLTPRRRTEEVYIEGLDAWITLRSLSHEARQKLQKDAGVGTEAFDAEKMGLLSIVASVVDPVLTETDVAELWKQDGAIIDEIQLAIGGMNLMGRAPELKKGSKPTQNSDLG